MSLQTRVKEAENKVAKLSAENKELQLKLENAKKGGIISKLAEWWNGFETDTGRVLATMATFLVIGLLAVGVALLLTAVTPDTTFWDYANGIATAGIFIPGILIFIKALNKKV